VISCYRNPNNMYSEADLRYIEYLCRRAKIALSLVFLRRMRRKLTSIKMVNTVVAT